MNNLVAIVIILIGVFISVFLIVYLNNPNQCSCGSTEWTDWEDSPYSLCNQQRYCKKCNLRETRYVGS